MPKDGTSVSSEDDGAVAANAGREARGLTRRSAIKRGGAAALVASGAGALASPAFAAPSRKGGDELHVGAGKAELKIPKPVYEAEGYANIHDPLYVRVVLAKARKKSLAIVVFDLTSINDSDVFTQLRSAITKVSGIPGKDTVFSVTHMFSGPHVNGAPMPGQTATPDEGKWISNIVAATTAATKDAVKGMKKARVGYGTGRCGVNINRNLLTNEGWYLGPNSEGPSDKTVEVARFDDEAGDPIAILTNYSVQSSVMGASGMGPNSSTSGNSKYPYQVTADLAGANAAWVEGQYDGVVAPFLCGATGDQQPIFRSLELLINKELVTSTEDAGAAGFLLLKVQGQLLGMEVVRVAESIDTKPTSDLHLVATSITVPILGRRTTPNAPTKAHLTYPPDGTAPLLVWVFRIGDGVFAGTPPELSTPTLEKIRKNSPFEHTFVMGMFEGGAKSMPDRWNFKHATYAAQDANWAPGDAEKYIEFVRPIIRSLH